VAATTRVLIVEDNPQDAELEEREIRRVEASCTFVRVETREGMVAALRDFVPDGHPDRSFVAYVRGAGSTRARAASSRRTRRSSL